MAFIIKALGAGTVTTVGANVDLYTVPAGKSALVSNVRFANNNATYSASVTLFVKPSGAPPARRLSAGNVSLAVGGAVVMEDVVTLGQADKLQVLVSGTSPSIGWMVNGLQRD
jgi:hypothetical protein